MAYNQNIHPNVQRRLDKEYKKDLESAEGMIASAQSTYGDSHPQVAEGLCRLGELYQTHSKFEQAEEAFLSALVIREDNKSEYSALVKTMRMLGRLYDISGKKDESHTLMQRAARIEQEAFKVDRPVVAPVELEIDSHAEFVDEMVGSAPKTFWTQTFGGLIAPMFPALVGLIIIMNGKVILRSRNMLEGVLIEGLAARMIGFIWVCVALFVHFHFFWPYRNRVFCSYGKTVALVVGIILLFSALIKIWVQ